MAVLVYLPTLNKKSLNFMFQLMAWALAHYFQDSIQTQSLVSADYYHHNLCMLNGTLVVYIIYYSFKYWCYWFYSYCKLLISTVSKHFIRQHYKYNAVWWNVLKLYYAYCQASRWSTVTISGLECLTGRHTLYRIILLRLRIILI